ncbi:hypothetical protein [Mesorhizobium temperatum]|uniref:hypothetical protein n=1 Tax=Mesorhizobium temperatum TaxID=241416 RepID=UPI001180FCE1|nr:hypothetical protein [Mesorhizobium temperatum]
MSKCTETSGFLPVVNLMISNTSPVPTLRYQGIRKLFEASIFAADPLDRTIASGRNLFIDHSDEAAMLPKVFISKRAKKPIHGRFRIEPLRVSFVDLVR